jgi:hypothetical protein
MNIYVVLPGGYFALEVLDLTPSTLKTKSINQRRWFPATNLHGVTTMKTTTESSPQ